MATATATEVTGVVVTMSMGLYAPYIQVRDCLTGKTFICERNSAAAKEAGMANPKHWAHAVYLTLRRLCEERQEELQGGSMDAYEETRGDRDEAAAARRSGN